MPALGFGWTFHNVHEDETGEFLALLAPIAAAHNARLTWRTSGDGGLLLRAEFGGEEAARAFWLELHERSNDANLAMELVAADGDDWQSWPPQPQEPAPPAPGEMQTEVLAVTAGAAGAPEAGLAHYRPEIPADTIYDLLRQDDPELDGKLDATIAAIDAAGMPVINLLSYLDLPLFTEYAAEHEEEREQNLFLHMLHTWTCYRRFGAVHAAISPELGEMLSDPRWLRINTTQFQSPAPALCLQLPAWWQTLRAPGSLHWVKEIYVTHCEPPTPADDRELTFMIVTHDERGQYGFVPLELPLSLPGVDQSIEAFFAPSLEDDELGANTQDLRRITIITAAYCLYACAKDPVRYLE